MPTTTTTTSTTAAAPTVATEDAAAPAGGDVAGEPVDSAEETVDAVGATDVDSMPDKLPTAHHNHDINKETIGDILIDQLETVAKTTERRSSMPHMTAKVLMTTQKPFYWSATNWLTQPKLIYSQHSPTPACTSTPRTSLLICPDSHALFYLSLVDGSELAAQYEWPILFLWYGPVCVLDWRRDRRS